MAELGGAKRVAVPKVADGVPEEEEANWRIQAIRDRVEEHRVQERSDALISAAKKAISNKKRQLAVVKKYKDNLKKQENKTKADIAHFSKGMEKFLDGADRQWMLDRSLRSMNLSFRSSSERLRDSRFLLSQAEGRISHIRHRIEKPFDVPLTTMEKIENELQRDRPVPLPTVIERLANGIAHDGENLIEEEKKSKLKTRCSFCNKVVLTKIIKDHETRCETESKNLSVLYSQGKEQTAAEEMDTALPPQPPMSVKVNAKTCDSITLSWGKPIFDGGASIEGYEIRWSLCHKKKIGKKYQRTYEELPVVWTSTWCLEEPIMHEGYTIKNLIADTEFGKVRVYTKNRMGYSGPSNEIESIETELPLAPSQPLFLQVTDIGSSSLSISWAAPLFSGGSGGSDSFSYEVQYTHQKQTPIEKGKEPGMVDVHEVIQLENSKTEYTLVDLMGDAEVRMIVVTAINSFGIRGPKSDEIMKVKTKPPKSSQVFKQELDRVKKVKGRFVESNLNQGFMQRFEKNNFIAILQGKLKLAEKDEADEEARKQAREDRIKKAVEDIEGPSIAEIEKKYAIPEDVAKPATSSDQDYGGTDEGQNNQSDEDSENVSQEDDGDVLDFVQKKKPPIMDARARRKADKARAAALLARRHLVRERQFNDRMGVLTKLIQAEIDKRADIIAKRAEIFFNIKLWAKRTDELQPELDRAMLFRGRFMDSSVMHNKPQRFLTTGLQKVLIEELELRLKDIADGKEEMIMLEQEADGVKRKQEYLEVRLKDRQAAYFAFKREAAKEKAAQKKLEEWSASGLHDAFDAWRNYKQNRQGDKAIMAKFIRRFMNVELHGAFQHWQNVLKQLDRILEASKESEGGAGTASLEKVSQFRDVLQKETASILHIVSQSQDSLDSAKRTADQQRLFDEGMEFFKTYKAENEDEIMKSLSPLEMAEYNFGISYAKNGDFVKAIKHFLNFSTSMQAKGNLLMMARAWCEMGGAYTNLQLPEKAVVHFDRAIALSREARSTKTLAQSYYGMGIAFEAQVQHRTALRFTDRAVRLYSMMKDSMSEAKCYRLKASIFKELNDNEGIALNEQIANDIEFRAKKIIEEGQSALDELAKKCSASTADETDPFFVEVCTASVPRIRREIKELQVKLTELEREPKRIDKEIANARKFQDHMKAQLIEANRSESTYMDSDSVHGAFQRFNVKELRKSLTEYIVTFDEKCAALAKDKHKFEILISNTKDDMSELFEELDTENGTVMRRAMEKNLMRACCLNPVNGRGHDVLGGCTGGIELFAFAGGKRIHLHDLQGTCKRIIEGDSPGAHIGDMSGHTKMVSSLCFYGSIIYSGSMDNRMFVWDIDQHECVHICKGHKATIWAIDADAVKIVSGSADNEVRVWDAKNFECAHILLGHKRAPKCIHVGPTRFVTGGADYEVRVWKVSESIDDPLDKVECEHRMLGHGAPVTCIKLAVSEIVSGAANGTLMVWSITHGHSLWKVDAHEGAILCLQFDATKIITGGRDMTLKTFDISSGHCLQTLRGHSAPIVALDFDHTMILTISNDGMMRRWPFRVHGRKAVHELKYHIVEPNDHIAKIAIKFETTVKNLREWNNIKDPVLQPLYPGMRLIVQKERKVHTRLVCSPSKAERDAELLTKARYVPPGGDNYRVGVLSVAHQKEMADAGMTAVSALDDIKSRFSTGSQVQKRMDELSTITAAATGTTVGK